MKFTFDVKEDKVLAVLDGELDTPATVEIQPKMDQLLQHADKQIIIECSALAYIASSGLRQLIAIYKKCKANGGHMILKNITADVMEIFKSTTFDKIFDIQ